eukprot:3104358-Pleurochrysis_carterae.AAC.2
MKQTQESRRTEPGKLKMCTAHSTTYQFWDRLRNCPGWALRTEVDQVIALGPCRKTDVARRFRSKEVKSSLVLSRCERQPVAHGVQERGNERVGSFSQEFVERRLHERCLRFISEPFRPSLAVDADKRAQKRGQQLQRASVEARVIDPDERRAGDGARVRDGEKGLQRLEREWKYAVGLAHGGLDPRRGCERRWRLWELLGNLLVIVRCSCLRRLRRRQEESVNCDVVDRDSVAVGTKQVDAVQRRERAVGCEAVCEHRKQALVGSVLVKARVTQRNSMSMRHSLSPERSSSVISESGTRAVTSNVASRKVNRRSPHDAPPREQSASTNVSVRYPVSYEGTWSSSSVVGQEDNSCAIACNAAPPSQTTSCRTAGAEGCRRASRSRPSLPE